MQRLGKQFTTHAPRKNTVEMVFYVVRTTRHYEFSVVREHRLHSSEEQQ
jgi:hypothetical protein